MTFFFTCINHYKELKSKWTEILNIIWVLKKRICCLQKKWPNNNQNRLKMDFQNFLIIKRKIVIIAIIIIIINSNENKWEKKNFEICETLKVSTNKKNSTNFFLPFCCPFEPYLFFAKKNNIRLPRSSSSSSS
mgnify:CR=1 FL=1